MAPLAGRRGRGPRPRPVRRRMLRAATTAIVGLLVAVVVAPVAAAQSVPAAPSRLRLIAGVGQGPVTLERPPGALVWLELGTYVVAGRRPFEVWARRSGYDQPVTAHQVVGSGRTRRAIRLPAGVVENLMSFPAFTHVTVKGPGGATVVEQDEPFCPAGAPGGSSRGRAVRIDPEAAETSPYPLGCPFNPFALGAVWGIQAGWGAPSASPFYSTPVDLADGAYTAVVRINAPYRALFGIPPSQASVTVAFTVHTTSGPTAPLAGRSLPGAAGGRAGQSQPVAGDGLGPMRPGHRYRPDLRPLPASSVWLDNGPDGELLTFSATVWNAGDAPLVVRGTRRAGTDVMDAHQYVHDPAGHQTGSAPVGTFEWDARSGHEHWHFTDFARYRLLDANGQLAVPSHKQAFCLANSDPVDTTIAGASWQPDYGFDPACGEATAQTLQQRLDIGSGDTYLQYLPGQAIDVAGVPNGVYHIEITANVTGRLHESNTRNNVSLRQIVLAGEAGDRFVVVPPYQGINS